MQLPNAAEAYIEHAKLMSYLLNIDHPRGGDKARVLLACGYDPDHSEVLAADLLHLAHFGDAVYEGESQWGSEWSIIGTLNTPNGQTLTVKTGWQIDIGSDRPRFITAHPGRRSR